MENELSSFPATRIIKTSNGKPLFLITGVCNTSTSIIVIKLHHCLETGVGPLKLGKRKMETQVKSPRHSFALAPPHPPNECNYRCISSAILHGTVLNEFEFCHVRNQPNTCAEGLPC